MHDSNILLFYSYISESSSPPTGEIIENRLSRLVKIGCDLYKQTIPIHSVNIHKPRNKEGKIIHVTRAATRLAFQSQFPSIDFISFEVWPTSFKVYLKNEEQVKHLNKKKLYFDKTPCYIFIQEPVNGVLVHIGQIPSIWDTDTVKQYFSEFGTLISASKINAPDGSADTNAIAVYEKAPEFMIENYSIRVNESYPAITFRFASKATCSNCSIVGHYPNQCPYPSGKIPEILVKKTTQAAKSKASSAQRNNLNKVVTKKGFETSEKMEAQLYTVQEDFQAAKKPARKPSASTKTDTEFANNFFSSLDMELTTSTATTTNLGYAASIEEPMTNTTSPMSINVPREVPTTIETPTTVKSPANLEAPTITEALSTNNTALIKKNNLPPTTLSKADSKQLASKSSKAPVNKIVAVKLNTSKSDNTVVSSLVTRSRASSNPSLASPEKENEITLKNNKTQLKQ